MDHSLTNLPRHQPLWDITHQQTAITVSSVESYLLFLRVASDMLAALQEHLERYDLSDGKLSVLMTLQQTPDYCMTPSQIAEAMGVTRSTMTGLLAGLERMELVTRQTAEEDGRIAPITLTIRGLNLLHELLPRYVAHIEEWMGHLSEQDKQLLREILVKISRGLPEPHDA